MSDLYVVIACDNDPTCGRIIGPYEDFMRACERAREVAEKGLYAQGLVYSLGHVPIAEFAREEPTDDRG